MEEIRVSKQEMRAEGYEDIALYLSEKLNSIQEDAKIVFEKDEYVFKGQYAYEQYCYITNNDHSLKRIAIPLISKKNIVVDGNGSCFKMVGRVLPLWIQNCEQIVLKNFSIDYKRPFFTQGLVIEADENKATLLIDKAAYPYKIEDGRMVFIGEDYEGDFVHGMLEYDAAKKGPALGAKDNSVRGSIKAYEEEEGKVTITHHFRKVPEVGNILTIKQEKRLLPGVAIDHSSQIEIENVHVRQSGTMAFIAQFSQDVTLRSCSVATEEGSSRVVSANADATHFVGCKGKVIIEKCLFESQLDDAFNVHGNYLLVNQIINDKKIIAKIGHFQQVGIFGLEKGDKIEILEQETMMKVGEDELVEKRVINNTYVELIFKNGFEFKEGKNYCLDNCMDYPEVIFRENIVRHNRARGILLTSRKHTLIEDNIFETEGACIKISGDMDSWFESGATSQVIIRHNQMTSTCSNWGHAIIDIDPEMKVFEEGQYYHEFIQIQENTIQFNQWPVVYGHSIHTLSLQNNILIHNEEMKDNEVPLQVNHIGNLMMEGNTYAKERK